jgi:hypothetical protein
VKLDVVVYKSSVLNLSKHPRKESCLQSFADGAKLSGARTHIETTYKYTPSKLAVILGWVTQDKTTPNVLLRQQIVEEQKKLGAKTMCIDAGCWKYADPENRFLRYSLDGPFYDQAEYANKNSDSKSWKKISKALNIDIKPWRTKGRHILVCMQRDGGFSMKNLDPMIWLEQKIIDIRRYTDRPIIIRPHPGKPQDFSRFIQSNISVMDSKTVPLVNSMNKAWAAVFFNSSSSVAAICEGIPIFIDDNSCVAKDVANTSLEDIENPKIFERNQWLFDLAAAHWSDEDGKSGKIYQKFMPFLI